MIYVKRMQEQDAVRKGIGFLQMVWADSPFFIVAPKDVFASPGAGFVIQRLGSPVG